MENISYLLQKITNQFKTNSQQTQLKQNILYL